MKNQYKEQRAKIRELSSIFIAQVSMLNEWSSNKCISALDHWIISNSLNIEHCQLNIATPPGGAG